MMKICNLAQSELNRYFDVLPDIQSLRLEVARQKNVTIDCLRLDKIHPFVSGNKWYKLKYHVLSAQSARKTCLLSFGGAHSNHLHALAYLGKCLGIETMGIVRGEPCDKLTPTLQECIDWGMTIRWLNRAGYRSLKGTECIARYAAKFPNAWIIPEGGSGNQGVQGIETLFNDLHHSGVLNYDLLTCAVGSGTTLAGIVKAKLGRVECLGFSALKGAYDLEHRVELELQSATNINSWQICHDYHFGGFAKMNSRLSEFISDVYQRHDLLLDPIYTGKMLYGLSEYIYQGRIKSGARVLMVHTGGLQGWRGFGDKSPI